MRTIHTDEIIKNIKEMCIEANLSLTEDMKCRFKNATESEKSPLGKQILNQLQENMEIAAADQIPICQDTGMAIVFLNIGQDVHIEGMDLHDAVNEGVRQGYTEGYLRKSVVKDPLIRENTKDNTPAIMHIDIVPGENLEILVAPKGFGSENMSRIFMLKPADGEEGIKKSVIQAVKDAGPNACPPMVIGVGIGGSFDKVTMLAKKAMIREIGSHHSDQRYASLEDELLQMINETGIGPAGYGGKTTALSLNIETFPTHIAGMPVAVSICCHVSRHKEVSL